MSRKNFDNRETSQEQKNRSDKGPGGRKDRSYMLFSPYSPQEGNALLPSRRDHSHQS